MAKMEFLSSKTEENVDKFSIDVGNAVYFFRNHKKLTIADLAILVGVSKSTISKIENGKQGYTGETIKRIAEALNIKASDIFDFAEMQENSRIADQSVDWEEQVKRYENPVENELDPRYARVVTTVVPLISWVQAGAWQNQADPHLDNPGANELVATSYKAKAHTYALRVRGESMEPKFPDGCIIIVEPEEHIVSGQFVIVRQNGDEATFKQYIEDGSAMYLKPLNSRYPIMELKKDAVFCGVVKRMEMDV